MSIQLAIIGCGRVAGHHIKAIIQNPNLELVALCDIDPEASEKIDASFNFQHYKNYHEMMKKHPNIDVVAIVTPSGMHFEHAYDMINLYKKHVVVEKPIVMTPQQGKILAEIALQNNLTVFPTHQYRFNRCIQRVKHGISCRELGKIFLATVRMRWCRPQSYYERAPWRGTFALDGGCTTNQGVHHLDLLRYLNGEVKRVNAVMKTIGSKIEVEDTVVCLLEFENGSIGNFEVTTAARPNDFESSLSILGSKGIAVVGGAFTDKLLEFSPDKSQVNLCSDNFQDAYGHGHNDIYRGVSQTLLGVGKPALTFEDGMKTIHLLHAIYASAEQEKWINLSDNISSAKLGVEDKQLSCLYQVSR